MATSNRRVTVTLDTYLSILAVISSFCAIGITFYQAYLQRTQQYASVMPVLDNYVNNGDQGKSYRFEYVFINSGIGPAFIKEYAYFYQGKPQKSFGAVLREIALDKVGRRTASLDTRQFEDFQYSNFWVNRVMPSNQEIKLVSITDPKARWVYEAYNRGDINVKMRYASIYDEQWVFESAPAKIEFRNRKVSD